MAIPSHVRFTIGPPHADEHSLLLVMAELPYSKVATPPSIYFDDTGCNPSTEPYFTWAGYVATYSFWQAFGARWNAILDREPRLPYWHQTDVRSSNRMSSKTPFRVLDDAHWKRRERSLCKLIADNRNRMSPIAVRVSNSDIAAHVKGQIHCARELTPLEYARIRPDLMERPHFIALMYAAKLAVELQPEQGHPLNLPISLHCENRDADEYQDHIQRVWKVLASRDPGRMGSLEFPPGKSRIAPQLQPADMLAWHLNRRAKRPDAPIDPYWIAMDGGNVQVYDVTADELKKHVRIWNAFDPSKPPDPASFV